MAEKPKSARKAACRAAPAANAQTPPPPAARGAAGSALGERPAKSALDSVVSKLVRAAIGAGETDHIADDDLDKYVADLVLKEAKEKSKLFQQVGTRAYLPHTGLPPCNLPKPNKRFLFNFVKRTDDHNRALLRQARNSTSDRLRELDHRSRRPRDRDGLSDDARPRCRRRSADGSGSGSSVCGGRRGSSLDRSPSRKHPRRLGAMDDDSTDEEVWDGRRGNSLDRNPSQKHPRKPLGARDDDSADEEVWDCRRANSLDRNPSWKHPRKHSGARCDDSADEEVRDGRGGNSLYRSPSRKRSRRSGGRDGSADQEIWDAKSGISRNRSPSRRSRRRSGARIDYADEEGGFASPDRSPPEERLPTRRQRRRRREERGEKRDHCAIADQRRQYREGQPVLPEACPW